MRNISRRTKSKIELTKTSYKTLSFEDLIKQYKVNLSALSLVATKTTSEHDKEDGLMRGQETLVRTASTLPIRSIEDIQNALKLWKLEEVSDLDSISDSQKLVLNCLSASI